MTSTFLDLHSFVRPPRLLVVAPQDSDWIRWSAAALGALSQVWGGCASATLPVETIGHPALRTVLDKLQPDHIVAYQPTGATVDALFPGTIERVMAEQGINASSHAHGAETLRAHSWPTADDALIEEAVAQLRGKYGVSGMDRENHVQCASISDEAAQSLLTPLSALSEQPGWGVALPQICSPEALSFAVQVGVERVGGDPNEGSAAPTQADWRKATVAGDKALLRPDVPDNVKPLLSPTTGSCIRITRGRYAETPVIVLGDQPEDFALAQLSHQVHGSTVWMPWADLAWHQVSAVQRRLGGHLQDTVRVTSASLAPDVLRTQMDACWDSRGWVMDDPTEEHRPYEITAPADLSTPGRSLIVLSSAWDQPKPIPVEESQ